MNTTRLPPGRPRGFNSVPAGRSTGQNNAAPPDDSSEEGDFDNNSDADDDDLDGDADDNSNDEWEMDSVIEDTLEEMGDEVLFEGGNSQRDVRYCANYKPQTPMPVRSKRPVRSDINCALSAPWNFAK